MCLQSGNKMTQTKQLKLYCLNRQNNLILIDVSPCHSQDLRAIYRKKKKKSYAHDNKNRKVEIYMEFFSSKIYLSVHV